MADLRLTRIDELLRVDHSRLEPTDECYFIREYTSGVGYAHSETNNLISNLKKPLDRRGQPEWRYKEDAMRQVAKELRDTINPRYLASATLVPMPPSKSKADPMHDDRLLKILSFVANGRTLDIRELLVARASTTASHTTTDARDPLIIEQNLCVDETVALPVPSRVAIFDDIITTGAHYRAACLALTKRFAPLDVIGIFIARRVFPTEKWG